MNLLDITENYRSENSSDQAGTFIHRQFLALQKFGHLIYVINPQPLFSKRLFSKYYPYQSKIDGINVFRPKFLNLPYLLKPGKVYDEFFSRSVLRVIKRNPKSFHLDLVLCDWIVPSGNAGINVSKRLNIPLILRARGGDVRLMKKNMIKQENYYKKICAQAIKIIVNGQGLRDDLIELNLVEQEKVITSYNGIDTSIFYPPNKDDRASARLALGIPAAAQVWVFIATWDTHKGTRELAKVIPGLMKKISHAHFLAAGPIRDKESFRELSTAGDRAHFLGMVDSQTIVQCLHAADIFILPSHAEGLPNSLLEAMACGLPAIVTKVGGIPNIIENNVNGLLIEPENEINLEEQIFQCAMDEDLRKRIGDNAHRSIFEQNLDLDSVASYTNELFIRSVVES